MPAWDQLLQEFSAVPDPQKSAWFTDRLHQALKDVAHLRNRNVLFYGTSFLQKPDTPPFMNMIMAEDINGFMSTIYGMACADGLDLVLHTPGGNPNAAETIVAYLRSKFPSLHVVVPAMAMSAGTMISLASDHILMGRQSQLGPIDPQFSMRNRSMSARGVVDQFERARQEILKDPSAAHVWAPITQSLGPALLQDAQNALDYSERMVAGWLSQWMFSGDPEAQKKGEAVAKHFNDAGTHKSHGRRIDLAEVQAQGVSASALEDAQDLQEAVLTLYHVATLIFEMTPTVKVLASSHGRLWMKNLAKPA